MIIIIINSNEYNDNQIFKLGVQAHSWRPREAREAYERVAAYSHISKESLQLECNWERQ